MKHKIVWLTGNSGAGKTTLARILREKLNGILLDGDEMRSSISESAGFSKKDREEHNLRVARLAKVLHSQGFNIIISVIAPFQQTRDKIDKIISPIWIYVKREQPEDPDRPYEEPTNPGLTVDTDELSIKESADLIIDFITNYTKRAEGETTK
jgi:adenylylsulfate kinase